MKGSLGFTSIIVIVLVIITVLVSVFTVDQTEQALVLRFGEPVAGRGLVTEPGLHFKIPFVENVVLIDKRLLDLESAKEEVLASDNTRIEVDAILRYRITDPLKFYQTVGTIERGASQLESLLNSAIRRVLGVATMTQIVRDEREKLMGDIRDQVNPNAAELGVEAVDVRVRRADLPEQISEKVFSRMQTERAREAAEFRAQGSERSQTIRAKADRDSVVIRAEAQRQADQTRGQGDAERNRIFAEAFGQDKDFFAFYRSMQAYEASLKSNDTRLVLSPKSEFFRFFASPSGQQPAAAPAK
ncbi:MAG: protease modulator HflC [Beijerinckiaceae bacterium]